MGHVLPCVAYVACFSFSCCTHEATAYLTSPSPLPTHASPPQYLGHVRSVQLCLTSHAQLLEGPATGEASVGEKEEREGEERLRDKLAELESNMLSMDQQQQR